MTGKASAWAEHLQRHFAGPMTPDEERLLRDLKGFIEFAIGSRLSFAAVLAALQRELNTSMMCGVSPPMTPQELDLLRDADATIEFAIRNGLSFPAVAGAIAHDVNSIAREDFDLNRALARGFLAKMTGAREDLREDGIGDTEESTN
jgi:hypothetical protein